MEIYKEFIVLPIDYQKKVTFLSTKDEANTWSFEIDWKFELNSTKPKLFLESGKEENEQQVFETLQLQTLAVSEAHDLLAFTCSDKSLFLCKINGSSVDVLSRRLFYRTASVIRFSKCGKFLFMADKTGDTFEFSCDDVHQPGRWIFGHISQILDLKINSDLSLIVTSDRDEKVRVTSFPATHEIEAFCVGHKEFVASVAFFNNEKLLLSVSGDKTLRFWDYRTGKQVQLIELTFVPAIVAVLDGLMAISSDKNTIYIYKYEIVSDEITKINLIGEKSYDSDIEFTGKGENFYIKSIHENEGQKKLQIEKVSVIENSAEFTQLEAQNIQIDSSFKLFKSFDVVLLYKKRYDNVKQYTDRKRARIENQEAKKK